MRIGIMLRHMGQHGGGVLVYTENLLRELFALESSHEFVLLYQDPRHMGFWGKPERVREVVLEAPTRLLWDQWAAWRGARRHGVDVLFNPKYSLPLAADCPSVFVSHGMDWYVMPWGSEWLDRLSHRYLVPRYARKADKIICVSDITREHVKRYLGVEEARLQTIYLGVDDAFRQPIPSAALEQVRRRYELPDRFFLYCGQIYPPKNFGRLVQAYARVGPELGISLVVAGMRTSMCRDEIALIGRLGLERWVHWPGWIGRDALPAFYALARALLLPSLYEACPLPILEAMASGCPVVTANRYGTKELAGDAGILVDPESIDSIADGIRAVVPDSEMRARKVASGRQRARAFSWRRCAAETLKALEGVVTG